VVVVPPPARDVADVHLPTARSGVQEEVTLPVRAHDRRPVDRADPTGGRHLEERADDVAPAAGAELQLRGRSDDAIPGTRHRLEELRWQLALLRWRGEGLGDKLRHSSPEQLRQPGKRRRCCADALAQAA